MVQMLRLHAESAGFDSLASHSRVEAIAVLALVDGELEKAIEVLHRGAVDVPPRAVARNRRWLAVFRAGLALEAGDLEAAANHVADAKPPNARALVGVLGLDVHLAARKGQVGQARASLSELLVAMDVEVFAIAGDRKSTRLNSSH